MKFLVISSGWLGLLLLIGSTITGNTQLLGTASFLGTLSGTLFITQIQKKFTIDALVALFFTLLAAITGDIKLIALSMLSRAFFYQLSALRYYNFKIYTTDKVSL